MHRPAFFAAVFGLGRAGSNVGDHFVQSDYCARVKGATDAKPVHFTTGNPDDEPTVHGTADGRKACAWHCLSLGLKGRVDAEGARFSQFTGVARPVSGVRQVSWTDAA
ncbi:hypothetical protein [Streptomyces sp. V1I1]|uniref:hypothetical protein n=1 Tax=Streptomyces sp. V1I1 TaxID=3042272 RepID=UPI00277EC7C2|nr:hypothetical protein [Streptomyces sp. V1I1]MDQ0938643.1 hypothetical protein [Streptomyces sp. V1I1]